MVSPAALGAGFVKSGNTFIKQSKLVSTAVGMVEAYQWYDGKAALDGFLSSIGDGYGGALFRDKNGEMVEKSRNDIVSDLPKFLEDADTVQVESFFSVQKLILQKAFEKIMGTGTVSERKNSKDKDVIGELAWWIGKPAGSSEFVSQVEQAAPHLGAEEQKKLGMDGSISAIDGFKYLADPGFGELGSGGNRPSSIYLGFYNKLDLVSRYVDGKDSDRMERIAGSVDPISATINQFNPATILATAVQNVQIATQVNGKGEGYMWEAQLLQASVMPLRVGGSLLVAAGTAAQFVPGVGTAIGAAMIAVGATMSAAGNSIHVDPKTGKRSYQMTDQGAMNTLVDVVGGATGGAVAGNAVAAGNAAAGQGAVAAANAAAAATKAGSAYAMATMTGLNLVNSGMEYDSDGRYTGHWSLSGERGDNALIGTAIAFASAGTASAMKLQQGTLASDLTRSIFSTGMHMTVQYGKMYAGQDNNYAAMAESDFSDLGSVLGTMMQSQSRDWQNDLADWAKDANDFNRTQRVLDLITGAGVFGRRENGELFYDAPEQAADTAWGRFWEGGMSTLGGYGALAGVIGEGLEAVAGMIGTGLGTAWNVLADGADWLGSKMLSGASWLGDKVAEWADAYAAHKANQEREDFINALRPLILEKIINDDGITVYRLQDGREITEIELEAISNTNY